jgi:hypothetical protein
MQFTYGPHQIYKLDRYAALTSATIHSLNTGAHNVIDYLMIFALFLLLVGLAMPTIIHLSTLLREDESTPKSKSARPLFASTPQSSRLAGSADRALV